MGHFSFINGFSLSFPISEANIDITIEYGFRTLKQNFTFKPHQDCSIKLEYSRFTGKFSFEGISFS